MRKFFTNSAATASARPEGRIPVIGTDKEARARAMARVPAYLSANLGK